MKKLLLILIIALFTVGCSTKSDKKEVVFWTLQMGDFAPYINDVIKNYEILHDDVKIKWIDVPFSEGEKRALASVMTDNPPDLINLNPDFSALLAQRGILQEVESEKLNVFVPEIV